MATVIPPSPDIFGSQTPITQPTETIGLNTFMAQNRIGGPNPIRIFRSKKEEEEEDEDLMEVKVLSPQQIFNLETFRQAAPGTLFGAPARTIKMNPQEYASAQPQRTGVISSENFSGSMGSLMGLL